MEVSIFYSAQPEKAPTMLIWQTAVSCYFQGFHSLQIKASESWLSCMNHHSVWYEKHFYLQNFEKCNTLLFVAIKIKLLCSTNCPKGFQGWGIFTQN